MDSIDEIIRQQVDLVLMEDIGQGDITTTACIEPTLVKAEIMAKSEGVVSGLMVVEMVFQSRDKNVQIEIVKTDGETFARGDRIIGIEGDSRAILTGERTALNFLGHLSGIATLTAKFVEAVRGTGATILDTRKTTPGLRLLDKYAVACGGASNHRFGLYDMALIKDNHIAAAGSITKAVEKMRAFLKSDEYKKQYLIKPEHIEIEVEVENESQLREAIAGKVKRLLLDNQSTEQLAELVKIARSLDAGVKLEASGNVNLANVRKVAETGVDFISIGTLTHSAPSSDFSLKFLPQ
ncbi:MAG: nicotinate-nucleotide diphosphorylase (carboxylating) [candidate division Zixibacteria bacterium HGW-Zixibacteria-1]|nr:MAG: nicotinate-nucleotide diphosphorylase (carboxylating) [candidate division Zixibacteria bacterium HGW-Zixibacteria-1]